MSSIDLKDKSKTKKKKKKVSIVEGLLNDNKDGENTLVGMIHKLNSELQEKDKILKEKDNELKEIKTFHRRNSSYIDPIKNPLANAESIRDSMNDLEKKINKIELRKTKSKLDSLFSAFNDETFDSKNEKKANTPLNEIEKEKLDGSKTSKKSLSKKLTETSYLKHGDLGLNLGSNRGVNISKFRTGTESSIGSSKDLIKLPLAKALSQDPNLSQNNGNCNIKASKRKSINLLCNSSSQSIDEILSTYYEGGNNSQKKKKSKKKEGTTEIEQPEVDERKTDKEKASKDSKQREMMSGLNLHSFHVIDELPGESALTFRKTSRLNEEENYDGDGYTRSRRNTSRFNDDEPRERSKSKRSVRSVKSIKSVNSAMTDRSEATVKTNDRNAVAKYLRENEISFETESATLKMNTYMNANINKKKKIEKTSSANHDESFNSEAPKSQLSMSPKSKKVEESLKLLSRKNDDDVEQEELKFNISQLSDSEEKDEFLDPETQQRCDKLREEIKKLKEQLNEKESVNEITNTKIQDLSAKNVDLTEENSGLEEKIQKKKDHFDREMTMINEYYQNLENHKSELQTKYKKELDEIVILDDGKKIVKEEEYHGKGEGENEAEAEIEVNEEKPKVKKTNKELESKKRRVENEIFTVKTDVMKREKKLTEINDEENTSRIRLQTKENELEGLKLETENIEKSIDELKAKHKGIQNSNDHELPLSKRLSLKDAVDANNFLEDFNDYEKTLKRKINIGLGLKDVIHYDSTFLGTVKKVFAIHENTIDEKKKKLAGIKESISDLQEQFDEIEVENLDIEVRNQDMAFRFEGLEQNFKHKGDLSYQLRDKHLVNLKEKEKKFEACYYELKQYSIKKQETIESIKGVIAMVIELCKIKKAEIKLCEMLQSQSKNQSGVESNIERYHEKENLILKKLVEFSNVPDVQDSQMQSDDDLEYDQDYSDNSDGDY